MKVAKDTMAVLTRNVLWYDMPPRRTNNRTIVPNVLCSATPTSIRDPGAPSIIVNSSWSECRAVV
jgi:hypothetical protein